MDPILTDLEVTKLCAGAMGLREISRAIKPGPPAHPESAVRVSPGKKADFWYDPLHDDAQAMGLLKKFCLHLDVGGAHCRVQKVDQDGVVHSSGWHAWPDLNRAVCTCIALMQKAKEVS